MSEKLKWSPLVIAILALAAIFAAACGDDDGNNPTTTATATEQTQAVTIDDPRIIALVNFGKTAGFRDADHIRLMAYEMGFTKEEVDAAIQLVSTNNDVKFLRTAASPSPSPDGKASSTATQSATAEATATPTPTAKDESVLGDTGMKPEFVTTFDQGAWKVHGTNRLAENPIVEGWIRHLNDPAPLKWARFPNIPNPDVTEFRVVKCKDLNPAEPDPNKECVPDGMQFGVQDSPYCFNHPCDFIVPAWEYRVYSGDYSFMGYVCQGDSETGKGCQLVVINVMDHSVVFRNQYFDNGWTMHGRYWNGGDDTHPYGLAMGVWGLTSHVAANMLNLPTMASEDEFLNFGQPGNSGANCGRVEGCGSVDTRVIIVAGDAVIAVLETTVTKP